MILHLNIDNFNQYYYDSWKIFMKIMQKYAYT